MEQPRRTPWPALVLTGAASLAGLAALALYAFPPLQATRRMTVLASAFLPYAVVAWLIALVALLLATRGRARWLALPLAAGLLAQSLAVAAYFDPTHRASAGTVPTLRLMALNMHYGQADLAQLLDEVRSVRPDVLVLTEFTSQADAALTSPQWQELLPYHAGTTGQAGTGDYPGGSNGTQVLSRTPLAELGRTEGTMATTLAVRLTANGHSLVLVAARPVNVFAAGVEGWLRESQQVIALTAQFAGGPLVVAGDLNSVPEHLTMRNLIAATGLHECVDGWQPSYPGNRLIPLIRIDHVLASEQFATVSMDTFTATGSDHRGVVAELAQS